MRASHLEISTLAGSVRFDLPSGMCRVGGPRADIPLSEAGTEELHVFGDPARVVDPGSRSGLLCNGRPVTDRLLQPGDVLEWNGVELRVLQDFSRVEAQLTPLADSGPPDAGDPRVARRLRAGLLCEIGAAPSKPVARWQEAVEARRFDPDACAADLLGGGVTPEVEGRLLERAARLQRDLLMAPKLRGLSGAARRARVSSKGILARVVAQFFVLVLLALLLFAALLLARVRWGFGIDGVVDRLRELLGV